MATSQRKRPHTYRSCPLFPVLRRQSLFPLITSALLLFALLAGCGPTPEELAASEYTRLPANGTYVAYL